MKHSTKRSLALLCCLTALLMCGCKGGTVSEANSDSLPAVTTGATAETVSETQPAPASTTAETESDSESASEDTTAEMPSGSPADMGTATKSEDGKRNAQLLVDYFYGNWQPSDNDGVMEIISDGSFYPAWFGVKGVYIDGSIVTFFTLSSGCPIIYKLDTAAPDKMQMSSLTGVYNDVERWSEREYTRAGEPEKTNVIWGVGKYRINQQYGIPYKTLWLLDYTDDDGTLWTTERLILNSESEDKLELTAQCYREVPSMPDDEYISVNYTVEKNGGVWERTPAVIQPASEDTTAEMPSGSLANMGTATKSEDGKRNAQLLVDHFYGNWQLSDNDSVMEINDGSFYSPWFGVYGLFIDGSVIELDTMSNGFAILYKLDTAAPDKMQKCTLSSAVAKERWVEYTRVGEPEETNVIQGFGRYRINQQYGIPYKTLWLLDYTDDDGTLWTTEWLILNSESEDKLELTAQCYREVPSMPDDEYICVNYTVEKNGDVWERTMTP